MSTVIRRNNWRILSDSEIEKAIPWMKITHRHRMTLALSLLLVFGIPIVVFLVLHIADNTLPELLKHLWVYIGAGVLAFAGAYYAADSTRKLKCFVKGEFQAVNVSVTGKVFSNAYRNHYYAVYVSGLFVDNKAVRRKIKVPRRIYNRVSEGDKAYVIKYDYKKTKDPLAELDFVPAAKS